MDPLIKEFSLFFGLWPIAILAVWFLGSWWSRAVKRRTASIRLDQALARRELAGSARAAAARV
ncbi:hypothetical protein RBI13_01305 [Alcaligenaceae bacterium A4P071]|nr:hypothetical protein [Alcaligenaceae bacterium B3P038]MDQ2149483.1 hypothetical protein [Alcaligenaceae bacterium C4P045]MDQ2183816.1 hypothetical protein [Alcaligenaceae bacterium A4P071]